MKYRDYEITFSESRFGVMAIGTKDAHHLTTNRRLTRDEAINELKKKIDKAIRIANHEALKASRPKSTSAALLPRGVK